MRMAHFVALLVALLGLSKERSGLATIYHPGDKSCGLEKADGSHFLETDDHFAHRWLPLGTVGFLCNQRTQLCTVAHVQDRGPFGALRSCDKGQPEPYTVASKTFLPIRITWHRKCVWWQAQPYRLQTGFKYRGEFDLTKPLAQRINHQAFDRVTFYYGVGGWKRHRKLPSPAHLVSAIWSELNKMRLENDWKKFFVASSN